LREYPLLQLEAALAATAKKLVKVGSGEGVIDKMWHTYGIMNRYTPSVVPAMRAARQQHGELAFESINRLHVPIALASMALLPFLIAAGFRWTALGALSRLAATLTVALLANAFVCGALANPHDRYGARLVWLAPLLIMLVPAAFRLVRPRAQVGALDVTASTPVGGDAGHGWPSAWIKRI
jgi:hypothetical protein